MRFVSDKVEEVSPLMVKIVIGSSLVGILPLAYMLYKMYDPSLGWADSHSDYKLLWAVFLIVLLMMIGLMVMLVKMKIEITGDEVAIKARIFPFMRSFRVSNLSEVSSLHIIELDSMLKYGGVGLKKQLGGQTSYTMTTKGHVLKIVLKDKKELHVQINRVEEWKRYIKEFKNQSV